MTRVDVYNTPNGFLLGMHIYYENGAQRTVGECYVGLQPYRSWSKPSVMYWSKIDIGARVHVVFDDDPTRGDSEKEWKRADLVGEIHICMSGHSQYFEVLPAGSWCG